MWVCARGARGSQMLSALEWGRRAWAATLTSGSMRRYFSNTPGIMFQTSCTLGAVFAAKKEIPG